MGGLFTHYRPARDIGLKWGNKKPKLKKSIMVAIL